MTFFADLNRHIAEYEAGERADEIEREMTSESSDFAVNGEAATLIPDLDVLDAEVACARSNGLRERDHAVVYIPGVYDDAWGRWNY